jgi:NAD(P)H-flavin reductase
MDWFDANVQSRGRAGSAIRLFIDAPLAVRESFTAPGQYVHLQVGQTRAPFAPASAPGAKGPLELLFKPSTPLGDALAVLEPGAALKMSKMTGPGFPLEKAKGHRLLLIASGTGQAPMRSVIESARLNRAAYGPITLLLGVRAPEDLAFEPQHEHWQADGIDVHVTLSQGATGWTGRTGWVQSHLPTSGLKESVAFIVGQKAMVDTVTAALIERGLPQSHVFLNV